MKKKILYLMEGIHDICIANSLKDKMDVDIYALIDTNDYLKKTFEKQDLVQFQKCWYYRDIVKKELKLDLDYLINFEKKYGINLWQIAYAERIFYKYNKYYKFNRNEILCILEKNCKLFESILDEVNPDFVITKLPDYNQSELFFELCRAQKKEILMLNDTKLGFRYFISNQPDKVNNFDKFLEKSTGSNKSLDELREQIKQFEKMTSSIPQNYGTSSTGKFKASFRYIFKICNNQYRKYYVNFGRTRTKIIFKETVQVLKRPFRQRFLDRNSVYKISDKAIFFALHFQPERSTLLAAPYYVNQLVVIENIARSLPVEYTLYVKEHPIQIRHGWKNIDFYKKILDMPNVKLIHPQIKTRELLQKCDLIIAITGTSVLEAAYYGKPSIIFGETVFSNISSIFSVKNLQELPSIIKKALNYKVDVNELSKFTNCLVENSFEHDDVDMGIQLQNHFFHGGYYYDYYISNEELHSFLEDNKKIFDNLGNQYMKKIIAKET